MAIAARATIRAHLRRFTEGGFDGPLRNLLRFVARANPALEADHSCADGVAFNRLQPGRLDSHVGVHGVRAPALPAQRFLGGGVGRGAKPPSES